MTSPLATYMRVGVTIAALLVFSPLHAVDRAIEDVRLSRSGDNAEAMIDLACSMRYVDHTPDDSGQELRVRLRVSPLCWRELGGIRSEVLRPEGRQMASIEELEFDAASLSAVNLTIRFSRPVVFAVSQSLSGLRISVDTAAVAVANTLAPLATQEPVVDKPRHASARSARSAPSLAALSRSGTDVEPAGDRFAIQLSAYADERRMPTPVFDGAPESKVYTREISVDGQVFTSLRLGFFSTEQEAQNVSVQLAAQFPELVIVVARPQEQAAAEESAVAVARGRIVAAPVSGENDDGEARADVARLMSEAKDALRGGDLDRSIALYTRALQLPGAGHRREAREYLGLARERNDQMAHARAEYEAFLAEFPQGPDAERVRQRLAGMLSSAQRVALNSASGRRPATAQAADAVEQSRWDFHGGVSQYYRHDGVEPSDDDDEAYSQSAVISYADFWTRREGERVDIEARFAGGFNYEMSSDRYGDGNQGLVSDAYLQIDDRESGIGARLGRQTQYGKGILGRFDGANLSYQWRPGLAINVTGGLPVDTPRHSPDGHRVFVGMSVDAENLAQNLDVSLFTHVQRFNGMADREAVGGEARYRKERWNLVASTDYDISYGVLNWALISGSLRASDRITFNARADIHAYPFLTTGNALIGQPVTTLDDLNTVYSEGQIRTLARDRTAQARTAALGIATVMTDRLQLNADVSYSHIDSTEASGGVAEIPDSGDQFYFDISLIGSSLMQVGDTTIVSLRRSTTSNATTNTLMLDMRYPVGEGLRLSPRVAVSQREYNSDGTSQWIVSPMLRMLYRWHRRYRFELDVGARFTDRDLEQTYFNDTVYKDDEQWTEYYINLGYQAEF